tara:strand:+ start:8261 stop:8479 length:219 start_codon:yes stop_codon:yes gene_type:complete
MKQEESSPCVICYGTGQQALFTSVVLCQYCDGLGWELSTSYKTFFEHMSKHQPDLLLSISKYYLNKLKKEVE